MNATAPTEDLELLRAATAALEATARGLDDAAVQAPSALGGWRVAHVLTHLARNADSHVRRLEGALEGRVLTQYAGGPAERQAAIDAGANRSRDAIVDDLVAACAALERAFDRFPPDGWDRPTLVRGDAPATIGALPRARLMEVEVHHVDLGRGYAWSDWPGGFADRALPDVVERITQAGSDVKGPAASWHLHRTDGAGEWLITRTPEGTTVLAEHAKADCALRGTANALIAFAMGRVGLETSGLECFGDPELAAAFPIVYPYG
jgi:maleylpyruvate isomerase